MSPSPIISRSTPAKCSSSIPAPVLERAVHDAVSGIEPGIVATRLHRGLADAIVRVAEIASERTGRRTIALTGGVFQNTLLLSLATERLGAAGFDVLTHERCRRTDGGLALGQAMIGIARTR